MEEKELIVGCKRKEPKAQQSFVEQYSRQLFAICMRYMRNEMMAKDALQESLIKILNNMDKYDERGSFLGWINTVTVRKNLEILRKEKLRWTDEITEHDQAIIDPDVYGRLEKEEVMRFIFSMQHKYRVALTMFLVEGFSHKEIAETLDISIGTSRSLVSRGRQIIKEAFGQDEKIKGYNTALANS